MPFGRFLVRLPVISAFFGITLLSLGFAHAPKSAAAQEQKKQAGEPFRTVFGLAGFMPGWWKAGYDHPADWFLTAWRRELSVVGAAGMRLNLVPTQEKNIVSPEAFSANREALSKEGKTSKKFESGQVQRSNWYGYGRYEVIMQPAVGEGLISAFYLYTGPYFGDTHEEIDFEFLGVDTTKIFLNRFRDGKQLDDPPWIDLGFDANERPRLYALEWNENSLTWYADDTELFRVSGADEIPKPPAKIYMDLWAGGPSQADWSGEAPDDMTGESLILCASFTPPDRDTPQCSDLMRGD